MSGRTGVWLLWGMAALVLGSCTASPPLTLYTLGAPVGASNTSGAPPSASNTLGAPSASGAIALDKKAEVIAVARVTIPDELDTADIVIRDGSTLRRSQRGRWASRLSLSITDRLTGRLAERRRDAVVTDRPLTDTPAFRVLINIGRLDVTTAGAATLDADWLIVPRDPARPTRRGREQFSAAGPVATDQDVVTIVGILLDKLAGAIEIPGRR
jgi:uncharacterized protein